MLEVTGLDAWYGPAQAIFDLTFAVGTGEAVALLGRNGAGKSTTLKALVGLVPRRQGTIVLDGEDISRLPTHAIIRRGIGFVPEDRRIFTDLTVEENLEVGRRLSALGQAPWTPERLYALFPNLADMRRRRGGEMSGGEQQMLTVARTLMGNPKLLLLDEPSEGLAPKIVDEMARAVTALRQEGLSLLLSEQNLRFAREICTRAIVLQSGQIRFQGSVADLEADPASRDAFLAV